jgi:hypothetical protein
MDVSAGFVFHGAPLRSGQWLVAGGQKNSFEIRVASEAADKLATVRAWFSIYQGREWRGESL